MAKQVDYRFKPLRTITTWAVILMILKLLSQASLIVCQAYAGLNGKVINSDNIDDPLVVSFGILSLVFLVILFASAIVTFIWIYGSARNTRALRPGLTLTPGWAVGWWFVPFASLYKPYEYMRDIWLTALGPTDGRYRRDARTIVVWWWTFIIGSIAGNVISRVADDNWIAFSITTGIQMLATVMFINIVRTIARGQVNQNTRVAEVF